MKKIKYLKPIIGKSVFYTNKCDKCPLEPSDCKKLILAGGQHICVI